MEGTVSDFDEERGWGTVEAGEVGYAFHCTQIADGTRSIAIGTPVTFEVRPGGRGRWEAAEVTPR